jgi:hypothetical protein
VSGAIGYDLQGEEARATVTTVDHSIATTSALHFTEVRDALNTARTALGMATVDFAR